MKKKYGFKELRVALICVSLLLFACSYFLIFQKKEKLTKDLDNELAQVEQQIIEKRAVKAQESEMQENLKVTKDLCSQLLEQYPSEMGYPDILMFMKQFEGCTKLTLSDIAFQNVVDFVTTTIPRFDKPEESMTGIKTSITFSFQGKYEDFKDTVQYLNNYTNRITIDDVTVSYDDTVNLVNGSMTISLYAVKGDGNPYIPPQLNEEIGKKTIFD